MESELLAAAAEALEQGRTDDAVAFLYEVVREAEVSGDSDALGAALALARRIPGEEAHALVSSLGPAAAAPRPAARLAWFVPVLALAAFLGISQLADRVWGPATPGNADFTDRPDLAASRALSGNRVYFVPIGRFDTVETQPLTEYLEQTYRIDSEVLPALELRRYAFDPGRDQLNVDTLLAGLARQYPVTGSQTVVIGLTDFDTFRRLDPKLRFVFSARANRGYAVVSAARLGPGLVGRLLRRNRTDARVRKLVERNVGVLFYNLQLRPDPTSLLRDELASVGDIDAMQDGLPFTQP